jgi:hypothetical protein
MHCASGFGKMEMKRINSSGPLRAAGYDERNRTLRVELTRGIYEYSNISPELARRLLNAPTPGNFFRDHIEEEFTGRRVK